MNRSLFWCIFIAMVSSSAPLDFKEKSIKTGLIFKKTDVARVSYDTYTIVYHVDIGHYLEITTKLEDCVKILEELCIPNNETDCQTTIFNIKNQLDYLKMDKRNIDVYRIGERKKRAIEFVGRFMKWAFGVVDADAAREYDAKINELQNSTVRLQEFQDEQLALVKETINLNKNIYGEMAIQLNSTINQLNELRIIALQEFNSLRYATKFNEITANINLLINEHNRLSTEILKCLEDTVDGKISPLISSTKLLRNDLSQISSHLNENQRLPIDVAYENPLHIFKFMKIRAVLYKNHLLFECIIPILERQKYYIYETFAIPLIINDQMMLVKQEYEHFLLDIDRAQYIPLEKTELLNLKKNIHNEVILMPLRNAYSTQDDSCAMSLLLHPSEMTIMNACNVQIIQKSTYFITIERNNKYFIATTMPFTVSEYCGNRPKAFYQIETGGFLTLEKNCRIEANNLILRARTNTIIEHGEIITVADHIQNLTFNTFVKKIIGLDETFLNVTNDTILIRDQSNDYNQLLDKANQLSREQSVKQTFEKIYFDNLMNSTEISLAVVGIISIMVIGFFVCLYKKFIKPVINLAGRVKEYSKDFNNNFYSQKMFSKELSIVSPSFELGDVINIHSIKTKNCF